MDTLDTLPLTEQVESGKYPLLRVFEKAVARLGQGASQEEAVQLAEIEVFNENHPLKLE